ncbi:MAG: hypothetical protein RL268_489 [Pseudomonadota bacterium]|jgi:hypothetical protein
MNSATQAQSVLADPANPKAAKAPCSYRSGATSGRNPSNHQQAPVASPAAGAPHEGQCMAKARRSRKGQRGYPKAREKNTVTLAPSPWDMGAMGPANRGGLEEEAATDMTPDGEAPNPNGVRRVRRVNMLETWHRKGVISTRGYNAGEKLRDAYNATLRAPGWPDNDRVQSSPKPDHAVVVQIERLSAFATIYGLVPTEDRPIISHCVLDERIPASMVVSGRRPYAGARYAEGLDALRAALERLSDRMERVGKRSA